ncbi:hypothetical protein [Dyadobacter arcticus]|uniref:Lipoprotein n=1 Tax=Dyadobacter arcticus TaxID=1078754 RepID=A0ABX0UU46_9BACT|nr:hypothetical protein [Dyadobacter arcticus]NIJ54456.1 hypothetical protein [Dyadobacter arcticus]
MKFRNLNLIAYVILLCAFCLTNSCQEKEKDFDCEVQEKEIETATKNFFANQNPSNCQKVLEAYDLYLSKDCADKKSYENSRDSFKQNFCK